MKAAYSWVHAKHQTAGFALPIVSGFGFLLLLLGLTIVIKSQGDQISAQSQAVTSAGLAVAESGLSRFQTLINQNREISTYPDCTAARINGVCPDSGSRPSWSNPDPIFSKGSCSQAAARDVQSAAVADWQAIDPHNPSKGQYRLISYRYTGEPGIAGPNTKGVLTVEGRVHQGGTGAAATEELGTATTRLQAEIPVTPAALVPYPFPGLWVKSAVDTQKVRANVQADCQASPVSVTNPGYAITRSGLAMPSPPPQPTTNIAVLNDLAGLTLPRSTDAAYFNASRGEYQYAVSNITGSFTVTPGAKVAIYLNGNLSMTGGQKAILHQCPMGPMESRESYHLLPGCQPTDVKIYGLAPDGRLDLGGNAAICDVFFLAPTYAVTLNGGGQAQGCGGGANNNGIYWVNTWEGGGQGNHIALTQTAASWDSLPEYLPIQAPPTIGAFQSWQRQRVQ